MIDSKGLMTFLAQKAELDDAIEVQALEAYKAKMGNDLNAPKRGIAQSNQPNYRLESWELLDSNIYAEMRWCHQSPDSITLVFPASKLWES